MIAKFSCVYIQLKRKITQKIMNPVSDIDNDSYFRILSMMFVCICLGVTDSEIVSAIHDGHDSVSAINRELGAAGCCGSCMSSIEALIDLHNDCDTGTEPLFFAAA